MDVGLVVSPSARAQGVPPRRARIRDDGRGGVRRQARGRGQAAHLFAHSRGCRPFGRGGGCLRGRGKGVFPEALPRLCGCGVCVRVVDALPCAAGNHARNEPRAPLFGTLFRRILGGGQPRFPRLDLSHGGHGVRERSRQRRGTAKLRSRGAFLFGGRALCARPPLHFYAREEKMVRRGA